MTQARARWTRAGFPAVTAVVFAVTAVTSVLGLAVPAFLDALERTPAGLHGQWWRTVTSLFVQDGGVLGTVSNLAFLALLAGTRLPRLAPMAVLWWSGALLATRWGTGALLAGIGGAAAVQAARPWAVTAGRLAAAAAVLAGVALAAAADLHGAALLAGVAIAAATRPRWPPPPDPA